MGPWVHGYVVAVQLAPPFTLESSWPSAAADVRAHTAPEAEPASSTGGGNVVAEPAKNLSVTVRSSPVTGA